MNGASVFFSWFRLFRAILTTSFFVRASTKTNPFEYVLKNCVMVRVELDHPIYPLPILPKKLIFQETRKMLAVARETSAVHSGRLRLNGEGRGHFSGNRSTRQFRSNISNVVANACNCLDISVRSTERRCVARTSVRAGAALAGETPAADTRADDLSSSPVASPFVHSSRIEHFAK